MPLRYRVVDVFADRPFTGNPLAVVLDADELSTAQLQALAREFNLSETAFPLRPDAPGADYRLRIFTPSTELPFAGHPSVGAAWVLADLGRLAPGTAVQSCGAGPVRVEVAPDGGPVTLTGGPARVGPRVDPEPMLAAAGLGRGDLAGPSGVAGAGLDFAYLPVRAGAVGRARPDPARLAAALPAATAGLVVYTRDDAQIHLRMFATDIGAIEDPATGSAALGLGVHLTATGSPPAGDGRYSVRQGAEIGRPSRLDCRVVARDGRVERVTVTGPVHPVAAGEVAVPPG